MMTFKASLRSSLFAVAAVGLCTINSGCGLFSGGNDGDGAFLEGDDVRIAIPSGVSDRAAGDEIRGDIYSIVDHTITDTNGWVTGGVEGIAKIYEALDGMHETSMDGNWRVYGPYEDDQGRDLAWLARLDEVEGSKKFEFYVGPRDAAGIDDLQKLIDGELNIDGDERSGGFNLYFDTVEAYPETKEGDDSLYTFAGSRSSLTTFPSTTTATSTTTCSSVMRATSTGQRMTAPVTFTSRSTASGTIGAGVGRRSRSSCSTWPGRPRVKVALAARSSRLTGSAISSTATWSLTSASSLMAI